MCAHLLQATADKVKHEVEVEVEQAAAQRAELSRMSEILAADRAALQASSLQLQVTHGVYLGQQPVWSCCS